MVNLELLTFAQSFLIVELSIKCTASLLAMSDENLALDTGKCVGDYTNWTEVWDEMSGGSCDSVDE